MVVTTVRTQKDGSLVVPAEILRRLGLEPEGEVIIEQATGDFRAEDVYLVVRQPVSPEKLTALRRGQVQRMADTLNRLRSCTDNAALSTVHFLHFREALEQLWALSRAADKSYRRLITLLQMAARHLKGKPLKVEQLDALATVVTRLGKEAVTEADVEQSIGLVANADIRLMIELPEDVLRSYHEEL